MSVPGFPHLRYVGGAAAKPAEQQDDRGFLARLDKVGAALGKTIDIFSGSGGPSVRGGGFAGDPHDRNIAADANIDGQPIGLFPGAVAAIHAQGLRSGATDFLYQGRTDPAHVDAVNLTSGTGTSSSTAAAQGTPSQFFDNVLRALGAPVNVQNRNALIGWAQQEGTTAAYNPLATTQPEPGATDFNSSHVKNYRTPAQGVTATAATIRGGYPSVLSALKSGKGFSAPTGGLLHDLSVWASGGDSAAGKVYAQRVIQNARAPGTPPAGFWHDPVVSGAAGAASAAADAALAVPRFLEKLTDPAYILRGLQIVAGAVLVIVGVVLLARQVALAADLPDPTRGVAGALKSK